MFAISALRRKGSVGDRRQSTGVISFEDGRGGARGRERHQQADYNWQSVMARRSRE
jgi:hypothetical protein